MDFTQNFSLKGKVAWVTGASYGIGFGIATAFSQAGATIVFNDLTQEKVDKGLASYKAEGLQAHGYVCNVCDEEAVKATIEQIHNAYRIIYQSGLNVTNALQKIEAEMEMTPEIKYIVDFTRASKRGIITG